MIELLLIVMGGYLLYEAKTSPLPVLYYAAGWLSVTLGLSGLVILAV